VELGVKELPVPGGEHVDEPVVEFEDFGRGEGDEVDD